MKCSVSDGLPEDCQKTTRRPLAVFWQSSNTMIQGNFYERLHFYMDSCAISPTASLLFVGLRCRENFKVWRWKKKKKTTEN